MKIIINADDCGLSKEVDKEIEACIKNKLISSTTIMANMADFEGAIRLYRDYKDEVSFGWHINLTEGRPLLPSQQLLDFGYYVEKDGMVCFNGMVFWKTLSFPKSIKIEIRKELKTQIEKIQDHGVKISHADSHQHIHTSPAMIMLIPQLLLELGINKCRRLRNYVESPIHRVARNMFMLPYKIRQIKMTDGFGPFRDYLDNPKVFNRGCVELMVHPGASTSENSIAVDEYKRLDVSTLKKLNVDLATYNEL